MQKAKATIQNDLGLHARPAALFVKQAKQFKSTITVSNKGKTANAKSLVHVLSLAISKDTEIDITAEGEDEDQALTALTELIHKNFTEA